MVKDLKIAYIGGGSKGWAWGLMSDLAQESDLGGQVALYDIDWQSAVNNEMIGNQFRNLPGAKGQWIYKAYQSIQDALSDADFVVISILPGDFDAMSSDVHTPEKYGIWQSVGDTVGPGGLVRALRTIPMYEVIAQAIKDYSPDAWVINYTNPMSICTRTLYRVFPEIKAFGCCHEVFSTQDLLAQMVADTFEVEKPKRSEIKVNVLGINHFTWLNQASWKNYDLMPVYADKSKAYLKEGYGKQEAHWMNRYFDSKNLVKFDLFQRYGVIAAAGDRHLAEFMPDPYLLSPEHVAQWQFALTPVSWRKEKKVELDEKSAKLTRGEEQPTLQPTGEEGVMQMKALLGLGDLVTNVNMPNQGQQPALPFDAVVETNAVFTRDAVYPIHAGKLPATVNNYVLRHVLNQELIIDAGLNRDLDKAFTAFMQDPLTRITREQGRDLFGEMTDNTKNWLSDYNR